MKKPRRTAGVWCKRIIFVKQKEWRQKMNQEILDKRIAVVGIGGVGGYLAECWAECAAI